MQRRGGPWTPRAIPRLISSAQRVFRILAPVANEQLDSLTERALNEIHAAMNLPDRRLAREVLERYYFKRAENWLRRVLLHTQGIVE